MKYIALALDLTGLGAIVAGVALLSVPAAFIVGGALCLIASFAADIRARRRSGGRA